METQRAIWWLPSERRFWMEPRDPLRTARFLSARDDAIYVTNPDSLDAELVKALRRDADADADAP